MVNVSTTQTRLEDSLFVTIYWTSVSYLSVKLLATVKVIIQCPRHAVAVHVVDPVPPIERRRPQCVVHAPQLPGHGGEGDVFAGRRGNVHRVSSPGGFPAITGDTFKMEFTQ